MKNKKEIELLKRIINQLRDYRSYSIMADDLDEESLYYLQEGYREGLCSAAMMIADELDAIIQEDPNCPESYDGLLMDLEESWWHTHNDENGDIGSSDRL